MNLTQLIQVIFEAIRKERTEGEKSVQQIQQLRQLADQQKQKIAALQAKLDQSQVELTQALSANQDQVDSILSEIESINPTPVADAIVETVQQDSNIETPPTLGDFEVNQPEVTPEEISTEAVNALAGSVETAPL